MDFGQASEEASSRAFRVTEGKIHDCRNTCALTRVPTIPLLRVRLSTIFFAVRVSSSMLVSWPPLTRWDAPPALYLA